MLKLKILTSTALTVRAAFLWGQLLFNTTPYIQWELEPAKCSYIIKF